MKQGKGGFLAFFITLAGLCSCDSIDCTLNNTVVMTCNLYKDGKAVQLNGTLTITAADTTVVLLNQEYGVRTLKLPLSYFNSADTLLLNLSDGDYKYIDTLWIEKTSYTHFESPDCPVNMFHSITDIRSTHVFIDSVTITQPDVNFAEHENLQIHLFSSAD